MSALKTEGFAHPPTNVLAFGITPGMTIVDFGSGSGVYALEMAAQLGGEGHVYAVDVQKDLLTRLHNEAHKRGYKNVEIVWGDLERSGASKLSDGQADLVLMSNILFQLVDKQPPLDEAWRILKQYGRLVVIDWSDSFGGMGPIKGHVIRKGEAMQLVEARGFRFAGEFEAGAHHYGLLFEKIRRNERLFDSSARDDESELSSSARSTSPIAKRS